MGQNKSLNPFHDDPFEVRLDRAGIDSERVRLMQMQEASWRVYKLDYLDAANVFKGIVLKVYENDEDKAWLNEAGRDEVAPRRKLFRMRVRIPEIHAHIPEVCGVGSDNPKRGKLELHPLFVGPGSDTGPRPSEGDIVRVSFTKGPKFGFQAGGIYHDVYMERLDAGSTLCDKLIAAFTGRDSTTQLGRSGESRRDPGAAAEEETGQSRRARVSTAPETRDAVTAAQEVFKVGATASAYDASSEWGERCPPCIEWRDELNETTGTYPIDCIKLGSGNHRGLDLRTPLNTVVRSPFDDGEVTGVGSAPSGGRGNWLEITWKDSVNGTEREYRVRYYHLKDVLVTLRQSVNAGELVARSGQSGDVRSHLHIEVDDNGENVNPRDYLPVGSISGNIRPNITDCDERHHN